MNQKTIQLFQNKIFSWWKINKRDLPWRRTHNPYHIVVSELMLQQTQVSRVLPKYIEFLNHFPTLETLAAATPASVITAWAGLGYNRRALYLHRLANQIVGGSFPSTEAELLKLPGVGLYTARAIQIFAFKKDLAAVDTNIKQILEAEFFAGTTQTLKTIQALADQLVPHQKSWAWHQALMDYGALALVRVKTRSPKPIIRFTDTNRFLRGRIIAILRTGATSKRQIINICKIQYAKSSTQVVACLQSLQKDSLIKQTANIYSLP